jgi:hypothetical protein
MRSVFDFFIHEVLGPAHGNFSVAKPTVCQWQQNCYWLLWHVGQLQIIHPTHAGRFDEALLVGLWLSGTDKPYGFSRIYVFYFYRRHHTGGESQRREESTEILWLTQKQLTVDQT